MGKWAIINWAIFNSYFDITRGYGIWQPTYCFGAAPKSFIVLGLFVRIWRSPRKGGATWCSCDGEKLLMGSNCEAAIFWKAGFGTNQVLKTVDMGRKIECLVFSFRDLFYVNPEKHNDDLLGLHILRRQPLVMGFHVQSPLVLVFIPSYFNNILLLMVTWFFLTF